MCRDNSPVNLWAHVVALSSNTFLSVCETDIYSTGKATIKPPIHIISSRYYIQLHIVLEHCTKNHKISYSYTQYNFLLDIAFKILYTSGARLLFTYAVSR